ncbi:hypothetical protein LLG95_15220 [bacterium]|nr:hypothetical protein [bacterium]
MPYKINAFMLDENHRRAHAPENYYLDRLRREGNLIEIDNIQIDAEQLVLRSFQCDTTWCVRSSGEPASRQFKGSCCTDLQVDVTEHESARLRELASIAEERLSLGIGDPMLPIVRRLRDGKFTERLDRGDVAFRHLTSSRCALSWLTTAGVLRCGINTLCDRLGLPLEQYKPEPCYLFPLHYVEAEQGKYFFTLISSETYEFIGADHHTAHLKCLRKPKPGSPPAYQSLRFELILCLGEKFYEQLEEAAAEFLANRGISAEVGSVTP